MAGGHDPNAGQDSVIRRLNLDRYLPAPDPIPVGHPQHCWVVDAPGLPGTRAGLLVEWLRVYDVWLGRVAVVLNDGAILQQQIEAQYLRPLEGTPEHASPGRTR